MANYDKVLEFHPGAEDFIQTRGSMRYRGEVLAYGRNLRLSGFSTDSAGFRHSTFNGQSLSVADCLGGKRHGIVLGASNTFGFGLAGDENTTPSLLADRFGFPFANIALPAATSRNLHTLLLANLARSKRRPAVVVLSNGGDLASFCMASVADIVFGPPNLGQLKLAKRRSVPPSPESNLPKLLGFTSLWTSAIALLCRAHQIPLVMIHQSTFFEKSKPTKSELESELGVARRAEHEVQFANHRKFNDPFFERRQAIAEQVQAPLAGLGFGDELGFIDEFHCDRDSVRLLTAAIGDMVEPLIQDEAR
jgi:hypothetical protein